MTDGGMNRHERRAVASKSRRTLRSRIQCGLAGHDFPGAWLLRPAWVGAGIVLPKVHYDRQCRRCGETQRVWVDVEGRPKAQARPMALSDWLPASGAIVEAPIGEVRFPPVAELAAIAELAGDE